MTSIQLPPAIFPENAITRAERAYQIRSAKKFRPWRRLINRAFMWLTITLALIQFFGLLLACIMQRDPTPLAKSLDPLPNLLILFTIFYHFALMFQTIALTGNSITREKESQTWEVLVLTGIDARQIVRGKWWAIIQYQLRRYLVFGVLRAGASAAIAIAFSSVFYYQSAYYSGQYQLPHPVSIVVAGLFGVALSLVNLGLSAACGVMGSAVSKRSTLAIVRGFANQIVISVVPVLVLVFAFNRLYTYRYPVNPFIQSVYSTVGAAIASLVDNGFTILSNPMYPQFFYNNGSAAFSPIAPIELDWMISALLALVLYGLLIWFALWRAEKRAVGALATPVDKNKPTPAA
jgi:hypothetical protein